MNTQLDTTHWSNVAAQWIAWARTPGHDAFWAYRAFMVDFVGQGSGQALEAGCGEGRVCRELKQLGYQVTATDAVVELVEAARQMDSAHNYATADSRNLPFEDGQFDLVVAYNLLMDVQDMPAVVKELRRVMKSTATLFVSLVHPFRDCGQFTSSEPDAPFVVSGTYFDRRRFEGQEKRGGLMMHFAGWSQPLEDYVTAFEKAGLGITSLREPIPAQPVEDFLKQALRLPLFLWLKARPVVLV